MLDTGHAETSEDSITQIAARGTPFVKVVAMANQYMAIAAGDTLVAFTLP